VPLEQQNFGEVMNLLVVYLWKKKLLVYISKMNQNWMEVGWGNLLL